MGSTSVRQPDAPDPVSAFEPMSADALFNRLNTQSPTGRQTYYRRDVNGDLVEWDPSDPRVAQVLSQALADPSNPDVGAILSVMPSTVRTEEDPRLRVLREQSQQADFDRRSVGMAYLSQMMGGGSNMLPESEFGIPVPQPTGENAGDVPVTPYSPWGNPYRGGTFQVPGGGAGVGGPAGTNQGPLSQRHQFDGADKKGKGGDSIEPVGPDIPTVPREDPFRARPDLTGAPDPASMNIPMMPAFQQPTLPQQFDPSALSAFIFGQQLPPVQPRNQGGNNNGG